MIDETDMKKIVEAMEAEGKTDIVGIWVVEGFVEGCTGEKNREIVKAATLAAIRDCLDRGTLLAGSVVASAASSTEGEFAAWKLSTDESLQQIEAAWAASGSAPGISENIWLAAPTLRYREVWPNGTES